MWILASRGRPHNIRRFIDAYNSTKSTSRMYVRLDECDPELPNYKKIKFPKTFKVVVGKRARLGAAMKELFDTHPDLPWYGLMADDVIPETEYWDKMLIEAAGTKKIAGAHDGYQGAKNLCHPVVGGDLVRAVGWFPFPHGVHYCLELPWKHLVMNKTTSNFGVFLHDVIVKHEHYRRNKSLYDLTYIEARSVKQRDIDAFQKWKKEDFSDFVLKCKSVMT